MERCKCCVFFDGISFCHLYECECPYVLICNDFEEDFHDYSEGDFE